MVKEETGTVKEERLSIDNTRQPIITKRYRYMKSMERHTQKWHLIFLDEDFKGTHSV